MSRPYRHTLYIALLVGGLSACGSNDSATDPLAYVPANTPYVMANQKPTPSAVTEAWMQMYGVSMEEIYADMAKDPDLQKIEGEFGEWLRAALPEVGKLTTVAGAESLGLKTEGRYALYGYGLLPVYRFELGDAARFAETVARIEERAGKKLATRKFDDVTLWQFTNDKATVLFGPIGNFLVVTVAPAKADEARLKAQLGFTLPEQSLASSKALATLDQQNGYTGNISGYIDVRALATSLTGRNQADNDVIAAFGGEVPKLAPECATELDAITAKFPRMVFGTKQFDAKQMNVSGVIEMEPALAKSLQSWAAPIPGNALQDRDLFRFAMSVNLPEAVRFLNSVADAITASPYQCAEFKDLNNSAAEMKQGLANPGLSMAGTVTAVHLGLDALDIDPATEMPKSLSLYLALGSPSPAMLWGLAQQSVPALAQVTLAADGKIVALPADAVPAPFPLELKAIMTGKSLALATSSIDDARLSSAASVEEKADGTILRYGLTGEFFKLIADKIPKSPEGTDEKVARDTERGREIIRSMSTHMDQMEVRMVLTDRGMEFVETISLK